MPDLRLPPFRLIHAAYVTADLEAGKRRLAGMFGVDEISVLEDIAIQVPGGEAIADVGVAEVDGACFECIHPKGGKDHVYRQLLPDDPGELAFHHFATRIENQAEWDMVLAAADIHGLDMPVEGYVEPGNRYIYLDTRALLGHMLEFIWYAEPVS